MAPQVTLTRCHSGSGSGLAIRASHSKAGASCLETVVEFAENPEPRCPCVLLLDTSASMRGLPIAALNAGLGHLRDSLREDALASRRVEVAIVTFDSEVTLAHDFTTADVFDPPRLEADGETHMAEGIEQALGLVETRKEQYRAAGVPYCRPWLFMVTDGEPQGESEAVVERAAACVREAEEARRVAFFAVGVQGANMRRLSQIAVREPVRLMGLKFREVFLWLSASMQRVSQSRMDDQVPLPPVGWSAV
jgi:uncharacterized protein YegL